MKLEKYVNKVQKRKKIILISISVIVLISVSLLLYKTFAYFTESAEFQVMKGEVDYYGNSDVYYAFYNENNKLEEMPQKDNKDNLVFDYGECDNGASIIWDSESWGPIVKNLSKSKTKCTLYFKEKKSIEICNKYGEDSALCYITKLGDTDYVSMSYDHASANGVLDNNLRYIGTSPNNYIDIGDRDGNGNPILWRIIGVMNNITNLDNGEQQESLIKIIRAESIGDYSWDTSLDTINGGWGVNEWSDSDIMKLLNPNTVYSGTPVIGGSLYWNREKGNCYNGQSEKNKTCDFTSNGLSEEAKKKIAKIRWNTGTNKEPYDNDNSKLTTNYMYESERSNHNGKEICESTKGTYCNDDVERTTTWDGYIGLMYPSDYGYAVGGSARNTCLGKSMASYNSDSCIINDWLKSTSGYLWTITPVLYSGNSNHPFRVDQVGSLGVNGCFFSFGVMPVAYLKSSIRILPSSKSELEYGSKENPFKIG